MKPFLIVVYSLSLINYAHTSGVKQLIQFEFITAKYSAKSYSVDNFEQILNNPNFDRGKPTAIYSYGFSQTINQQSVRDIVDAYLENGDFNFVLMNYQSILSYNILSANEFGENIASSLIKLFEAGYGNFHLIGFSLGAQITGVVGRSVISASNQTYIIPRITGLDPGQILPFFEPMIQNLNAGDASFVDTIHGESKLFGSASSLGNASFWINGGYYQPSCQSSFFLFTSVCSHLMTPKYWAASIRSKNSQMFPAVKCESFESLKSDGCDDASIAFMGFMVDKSLSGRFYLLNKTLPD